MAQNTNAVTTRGAPNKLSHTVLWLSVPNKTNGEEFVSHTVL